MKRSPITSRPNEKTKLTSRTRSLRIGSPPPGIEVTAGVRKSPSGGSSMAVTFSASKCFSQPPSRSHSFQSFALSVFEYGVPAMTLGSVRKSSESWRPARNMSRPVSRKTTSIFEPGVALHILVASSGHATCVGARYSSTAM